MSGSSNEDIKNKDILSVPESCPSYEEIRRNDEDSIEESVSGNEDIKNKDIPRSTEDLKKKGENLCPVPKKNISPCATEKKGKTGTKTEILKSDTTKKKMEEVRRPVVSR